MLKNFLWSYAVISKYFTQLTRVGMKYFSINSITLSKINLFIFFIIFMVNFWLCVLLRNVNFPASLFIYPFQNWKFTFKPNINLPRKKNLRNYMWENSVKYKFRLDLDIHVLIFRSLDNYNCINWVDLNVNVALKI